MIGSGLKKLAQENGMKIARGVAYGNLKGFATTLCEGEGYKQITISTKFTDPNKLQELQMLVNQRNISRELRVRELTFMVNGVNVVFNDTIGTMKKVKEFIDWFFPLLKDHSATDVSVCSECGGTITGGSWKLVDGVAFHMHEACADKVRRDIDAEDDAHRLEDNGSYGKGLVGALLGAALGAVVWALVLMLGYVASLVGLLIGWLAEKGYTLLHGKQGKGKVAILIVAVIFGVVLGTFAADAISLAQMISSGELYGFQYSDIPVLFGMLLTDSEYVGATVGNIFMGLLFAALGVFALLRKAGKAVSKTKVVDLP